MMKMCDIVQLKEPSCCDSEDSHGTFFINIFHLRFGWLLADLVRFHHYLQIYYNLLIYFKTMCRVNELSIRIHYTVFQVPTVLCPNIRILFPTNPSPTCVFGKFRIVTYLSNATPTFSDRVMYFPVSEK